MWAGEKQINRLCISKFSSPGLHGKCGTVNVGIQLELELTRHELPTVASRFSAAHSALLPHSCSPEWWGEEDPGPEPQPNRKENHGQRQYPP